MAKTVEDSLGDRSVVDDSSSDAGEVVADQEANEVPLPSELLEQVGRNASTLVLREVQLATSHHIPELRRAGRDLVIVVAAIVSLAASFVLANWAVVAALSSPLPGWRAPLIVAAMWAVVGGLLAAFVFARRNLLGITWRRALVADPSEVVRSRERARDAAEQALRDSLGEFADAVASEAGALVADAVVPFASDAVDLGEDVIDGVDDMTDAIAERVPGGGVINQMADLMLLPGRYVLRVVGTRVEPAREEDDETDA